MGIYGYRRVRHGLKIVCRPGGRGGEDGAGAPGRGPGKAVIQVNGKLNGHIRDRLLASNFWHLATVGADGAPQVSPMWADIEGEYVMVNTSIGRVKEQNLRRNPYVSLSHHDPANPYDRAEIRGRVVRFVEGEEAERAMDRLARKYLGEDRYPWLLPGERRVMLLIEPLRVRRLEGVEPFRAGVLPEGAGD